MKGSAAREVLVRRLQNVATIAAIIASGVYLIQGPASDLFYARRSRVGLQAATRSDSIFDIVGVIHPTLAADSTTLVFFMDANCAECRADARGFVGYARWAALQGAAVRLVLPNERHAAEQFAKLVGDFHAVMNGSQDWTRRLGIRLTPSVILLDRKGLIRGRWLGHVPNQLSVLNALGKILRASTDDVEAKEPTTIPNSLP